MGIEVVGFEPVQGPVETMTEGGNSSAKENGKFNQEAAGNEPIKFGSHGDESVKKEGTEVSASDIPKDAVEEWPTYHTFYFVRHFRYDDPKVKAKLAQANTEITNRNTTRIQFTDAIRAKRTDRAGLIEQIKALRDDNRQIRSIVDEKFKDLQPLQQALGQLRSADNASRSGGLCSSEGELNSRIQGLQYIIQHESIPLSEEKKILKEIRTLESTRGQVIANAAMIAKIEEVAPKEALRDQVKLMGGDLNGVKKEQQAVRSKIKLLDDAVKAVDKEIAALQDDLNIVIEKREKARDIVYQLRRQGDEGNAPFFQSRVLLTKARNLAAAKDIKALEELSHSEVEKFMSLWNSNKECRDDYETRVVGSLDRRLMSRDGRIRNPDEKPLSVVEAYAAPVVETASKPNAKQVREDTKSASQDTLPVQKPQKEAKNKATAPKSAEEHVDVADKEISDEFVKQTKESIPKETKVDAEKLKEMKREEEIEKHKLALERKKKKAEKDAAKAAIRAQKEAEKKQKEREKKAKKKASSTAPETNLEEATEAVAEAEEPEKVDETVEAPPVPVKAKVQKDSSVRSRGRARGAESLPKAILKRKKSSMNYWVWAAAAASLVVLLVALGYQFLL